MNTKLQKREVTYQTHRCNRLCLLAVAAAVAVAACSAALAEPNTGGGPRPPIGGGGVVIGPALPPGIPCNPPQLPPGILMPSYAIGRIQETCSGVLRPVTNKPVEVILRVQQQPFWCDPNNIPPAYHYEVSMATGTTDDTGAFEIEFWPNEAGINPDNFLLDLKVRIVVYDDTGLVPIWQTAYYGEYLDHEFHVYEDVVYCLTEGTRIRVVSPSGQGAYDAEVFVNGSLYPERTNANGFVTINPPLAAGAQLVARARVHESRSERGAHAQGSNQNWKYRAYITSLPLTHDGTGGNPVHTPVTVTDPNGAYQLNLRRDASYIGLHLVASLEWDASPAELNGFANRMRMASDYFYNATDGQMLIERVDVFDDKHNWDQADFRVYADLSLRAHVDWPSGGFWTAHDESFWRSNWMHMSRSNDDPVYVHEFGHYGMRLKDEYEDDGGDHCAHGVGGATPAFDSGGGKASCMMYSQWGYTKICSAHPDNPHLTGTRQGDEDCWSELKRHFTEEAPGPGGAPRWRLLSPVDRGAIIDRINGVPVADWDVLVETNDANNVNLCQPVQFQWASHGGFADGARVFSKNSSGRTIIQGVTDATGVIKPFQGSVRTVAGLHIGDTIGAMWTMYTGNGYTQFVKKRTFTDADCQNALVILNVAPGQPPPAPREQFVEGEVQPFGLAAQLEPGAALGEAVVRVRADAELAVPPVVRLSVDGETAARDVTMALDAATGEWVGTVAGLPEQFAAVAEIEAADDTGAKAAIVTQAAFSGAVHDEDGELATADGLVELHIPAGALAQPTQIAIGGAIAPLPHDFPGRIVTGPVAIAAGGATLSMPAALHFGLPFDSEDEMLAEIDPSFLIVLAYDEATGRWSEVEGAFHHGEPGIRMHHGKLAMEVEFDRFGTFVLLERGLGLGGDAGTDAGAGAGDASGNSGGDAPSPDAGSADCGTGACGAGTALASPLMLAMLGMRRIRRRPRGEDVAQRR